VRDVVEEGGGEFVLPLKGFVCLGWERDWLVFAIQIGTKRRACPG
jgi:hypothetical protein